MVSILYNILIVNRICTQKTGIAMMVSEAGKRMLTDTKLRNLKPAEKPYKLTDRDGLYVTVLSTGTISFRYNYRINNRQETLVIGLRLARRRAKS